MGTKKKVLVIRLGALGDVVRTLPTVKYLYDNYKKVQIDWLVESHNANILKLCGFINKVIIVERKKWQTEFFSDSFPNIFYEFYILIKKLQSENYDYVIDFHGIFKSGLFSFLSLSKKRIGFTKKYSKEGNYFFNNINLDAPALEVTRIEKNFSLLNYFFEKYEIPQRFENIFSLIPSKKINNFFEKIQLKNIICVNPAVSKLGKYKEWPEKYFSKLIDLILKKYNDLSIVLSCGPGEYEKINRIYNMVENKNNLYIKPETNLSELTYFLSKVNLLITGDTGPMHIANMLGIKIAALFGPSDNIINRPWGKDCIIISKNVDCSPCRNRKCKILKCQFEMKPEFVLKKISHIKLG